VQQPRQVYVTPTTHVVGLGARLGDSTMGFGASARAWGRERLGFQMAVSRSAIDGALAPERLTVVQIEPSVLFAFRDHVHDYVWVRPYVGSGAGLRRQTLSSGIPGAADSTTDTGFGVHGFGGGEFTFPSVPRFALSADVSYRWSRMPVAGYDLGGLGFAVSGHWYVK
jgi:hypothetical protein